MLMMAAINVLYGQMVVKNSMQTELVRITNDGLVGVNTPTPSKLVSVKGAGANAINIMPKSSGSNIVGLDIILDGNQSINNGSAGIYITNMGKTHGQNAEDWHHMGMNIASALPDNGNMTENSRNWTFLPGGAVIMSTHIGLANKASGWTQAFGTFSNLHGDRLVTENYGQIGAANGALSAITLVPNPAVPFIADGSMGYINNLTTDTRFVRGVMGRLHQIESWYPTLNGTNGASAAVSGEVFDNDQKRPGVFAGYFSGAKSYFYDLVGISTTNPQAKLHVKGSNLITTPSWLGPTNITVGGYFDNSNVDQNLTNKFAVSGLVPVASVSGTLSAAVHGNMITSDPNNPVSLAGAALAGSRNQGEKYLYGVHGIISAANAPGWLDANSGFFGAALYGSVEAVTPPHQRIYAGYFEGAKSYFGANVGIGTTNPSSALDVVGDVELASNNAFYLGDPNTDGSWRIIRSGNNLVFQSRKSGAWVNGTFNFGVGGAIVQP